MESLIIATQVGEIYSYRNGALGTFLDNTAIEGLIAYQCLRAEVRPAYSKPCYLLIT